MYIKNNKPNFEDAPKGAKWIAQDRSGMWCWYTGWTRPTTGFKCWVPGLCGTYTADLRCSMENENWKSTLERVPKKKKIKVVK